MDINRSRKLCVILLSIVLIIYVPAIEIAAVLRTQPELEFEQELELVSNKGIHNQKNWLNFNQEFTSGDSRKVVQNLTLLISDTGEDSGLSEIMFEIIYLPLSSIYFIAVICFFKNVSNFDRTWTFSWVGLLFFMVSYIEINRDFCYIFLKAIKLEMYTFVHFILLFMFSILSASSFFLLIYGINKRENNLKREIKKGTKKKMRCLKSLMKYGWLIILIKVAIILLIQGSCIVGSFFIIKYFSFLTSNIYIVIIQNLFWAKLLLYSLCSKVRLQDTRKGLCSIYDWIVKLCVSIHLTFSVNFIYIFKRNANSNLKKILLVVMMACIHCLLILSYMVHQTYFCGPYYPKKLRERFNTVCQLGPASSADLEDGLLTRCDLCAGSLREPSAEVLPERITLTDHISSQLLSSPPLSILSPCSHQFHPECFLKLALNEDSQLRRCSECNCKLYILFK
ncbi:unnamed protein product [Moneuplotes crassus]|uniref:RING-type domain-containing protein n=1 Tax=Euplotes crassus TaxID=5936 RepID=A0AAD1UQG2_EUPCR|nr:unnamed protein product [Moneuplotes crassus]